MTPEAGTALIARSQPKVAELLVLAAVTIFLAYVGLSAFDPSLPMVIGPRRLGRLPQGLGIVFLVLAAVSLAATVWQIRRRLNPNVDVVVDAEGIASQQSFWGRGRLAWSEITGLKLGYQSLLYIDGISTAGDAKRLVIDTRQIDVPAADLYAVIARHRPDLDSKPRS
jgi:hypothetical protein